MHRTVFKDLATNYLEVRKDEWYVDATFGAGGHTEAILQLGGKVVAFDYDESAISKGQKRFKDEIENGQLILVRENFDLLEKTVVDLQHEGKIDFISGVLLDLGTSTDQLMSSEFGLSFSQSGPLDMRLDNRLGVKAADLIMVLSEKQLATLFFEYGGELEGRQIAKAIVSRRNKYGARAFASTGDLVTLITATKKHTSTHLHPATKVFQALRIAVNDEIANLERVLPQAFNVLAPKGRLVTIAFHEGEDRPIKQFMKNLQVRALATLIEKRPVLPDRTELKNPRSRSAKMRILEKL
ncbi:MAG: 16S rRNA (cytosine(1402)-N(4))-methyltransferase RsmH [Pseudomonadales bacterium]|nr:16S rRNA (cytosine(1402)-N(4))-methyltransferase RsmH [Pseudomonadales bacterium]